MSENSNPLVYRLSEKDLDLAKEGVSLFLEEGETVSSDEVLRKLLQREDFYFVVATLERKLIGRLIAYEFEFYKDNTREVYLYEVDVLEEFQNKEIGTKLIEFTKQICSEREVSCMFVGTEAENIPAQKLYAKTGGTFEGNLPHYIYEF